MKRMYLMGLLFGMVASAPATIAPTVTFYRDVLPVLQNHCQSCHRHGQVAPISFLTYRETRPWAEAMKYVVVGHKMPPWYGERQYMPTAADHSRLTLSEIDTIVQWAEQGAPAGDPKDAPPPAYMQEGRKRLQPAAPTKPNV